MAHRKITFAFQFLLVIIWLFYTVPASIVCAQNAPERQLSLKSMRHLNYTNKETHLQKVQPSVKQFTTQSTGFSAKGGGPAACFDYAGGPYADQGIDEAGCNGASISAPYEAWLNEVYFTQVVSGGNYTFSICNGYSATAWGGAATITAILNGTPSAGTITGGTLISTVTGCSLTFTASADGVVFFVLSTATACGGAISQVDNGFPTITTNSGVPCGSCGNTACEVGENYCNCSADCACNISGTFIDFDVDGNAIASTTPSAFCENFVTGFVNPSVPAHIMYVPFAIFGVTCVTDYTVSATEGMLYIRSGDTLALITGPVPELTVLWLQVTQADVDASGGVTTISISGAGGDCTDALDITWTGVANYTGSVDVTCKSVLVVGMFLEGAYNTTSGDTTMRTDINTLIPLTSPYAVAPWNAPAASVATMPTAVVDWVLVELRDPATNALVESQAGLLSTTGYVFDTDLNFGLTFNATGEYNVIVRHRNHLPVMSSGTVDPDGTLLDMALLPNILGGEQQVSRLGALNLFALKAGDVNANGIINRTDFNIFKQAGSLLNTYNSSDCNMDKNVSPLTGDFPLIRQNTSALAPNQVRY